MTWSCRYCTFFNEDDGETQCSVCGMPGKRVDSKQAPGCGGGSQESIDLTGNGDTSTSLKKRRSVAPPSASRKRRTPATTNNAADSTTSQPSGKMVPKGGTRHRHSFSYKVVPKRAAIRAESDADNVLRTVFQLERLRNLQPLAVKCALELKSQMIVMATGGGKYVVEIPCSVWRCCRIRRAL
jgi:hypothetical protein